MRSLQYLPQLFEKKEEGAFLFSICAFQRLLPSIYIPLWEADVLEYASLSEAIVSQDDTSISRAFKDLCLSRLCQAHRRANLLGFCHRPFFEHDRAIL